MEAIASDPGGARRRCTSEPAAYTVSTRANVMARLGPDDIAGTSPA